MNIADNEQLRALLAACVLGEQRAFARLYQLTAPKLFAVLLRILKHRELAEDALQEAFIKIWHHAEEYRPERGDVMVWLMSIARYRALDMLRRHREPDSLEVVSNQQLDKDSTADPYDTIVIDDDTSLLQKCLKLLGANEQQSVLLAYREGYTHQELSQRLNKPLGTIKSWIRRGLQRLKRCLEDAEKGV